MNANFANLLRQNHLRATPARIQLLKVLSRTDKPLDVQSIWKLLDLENVMVDQTTVYRTLEIFVEHEMVKVVYLREGKLRYELNSEHHHHLTCNGCGEITPIYDQCLGVNETQIKDKYGFMVSDHSLEFFGECQQCHTKG